MTSNKYTPLMAGIYKIMTFSNCKRKEIEIRSSWSWFEHCSESLVYSIGSHIRSLFAPIHMNHSSSPYEVILLVIICPNAYDKLTKSEIMLSWSRFEHCSKLCV